MIICLLGCTASGKTQAAIELVQKYPFEIISVDASMVYREMNIGTAKPDAETLKLAPHHLIDIRDPTQAYSVGQFCEDAVRAIDSIKAKGKIPLLVGGSMLYFNALQNGLSSLPVGDPNVRKAINEAADQHGWPSMHQQLQKIDPQAADHIHPNDAQRISRALEIYQMTGQSWIALRENRKPYLSDFFVTFGISVEREILTQRIEKRFDTMLKQGWIDEVEILFKRDDLSENNTSMRAVGYRQIWKYLQGELTYSEMREKGIIATRQLAKRQMTWLRSWNAIQLVDPLQLEHNIRTCSAYSKKW